MTHDAQSERTNQMLRWTQPDTARNANRTAHEKRTGGVTWVCRWVRWEAGGRQALQSNNLQENVRNEQRTHLVRTGYNEYILGVRCRQHRTDASE